MSEKVLLVGVGNMGRKYLNKFLQLGITPLLLDTNENLKKEFSRYPFYTSPEQIEEIPKKVFIAINPQYHPEVADYFLSKGCYVFLEKPPALAASEFSTLLEKYGKSSLGVSEIERYSAALKGLKIEKPTKVIIKRLNRGRGYINPIWDLAWHDFYLLLYLFGNFSITKVEKKGNFHYSIEGLLNNYNTPFVLEIAWNYPYEVQRNWLIETPQGSIFLDFLNERRIENSKITAQRKDKDKLLEMVEDALNGTYDPNSSLRALKILQILEKEIKPLLL
jgi:predicted dehydrogenase